MNGSSPYVALRDLPLPPRLLIAVFLISVGLGYFSALVQLHFQHAPAGKLLPGPEDAVASYHAQSALSQLERLLTADESQSYNGSGSMRAAFTTKSAGWQRAIKRKAKEANLDITRAEAVLRQERDGERLALLAWNRSGAEHKAYETDHFPLPVELADHAITEGLVAVDAAGTKSVHIRTILENRCVRCHSASASGRAAEFPLDSYVEVREYCRRETTGSSMSLKKLAQTTHVHLLGFAMLYGLTGMIFAFTSYPRWARSLLGPLPLLAQVADISCWWLGRIDLRFARSIVFTGGMVALGLFLQLVLSLNNLFGRVGKIILALLFLAVCLVGYLIKAQVIDPYLLTESFRTTE